MNPSSDYLVLDITVVLAVARNDINHLVHKSLAHVHILSPRVFFLSPRLYEGWLRLCEVLHNLTRRLQFLNILVWSRIIEQSESYNRHRKSSCLCIVNHLHYVNLPVLCCDVGVVGVVVEIILSRDGCQQHRVLIFGKSRKHRVTQSVPVSATLIHRNNLDVRMS